MIPVLLGALFLLLGLLIWNRTSIVRLKQKLATAEQMVIEARQALDRERAAAIEANTAALAAAEQSFAEEAEAERQENERIRRHHQSEAARVFAAAHEDVTKLRSELAALQAWQGLARDEADARALLTAALREAEDLRTEGSAVLDRARAEAVRTRETAQQQARIIRQQYETLLARAIADAARLVAEAHQKAETIAGDAYLALRERDQLEAAVKSIRNLIEGYGDRYIVPTRSIIDDLAADFGHTEAGQALAAARVQTARMVEEGLAATCDYAERNRRDTAIRFATDAFNGRVDALLSEVVKGENFGTLEQQIRDVFSLVNLNGSAFRNARILPAYLDARLSELRWSVATRELKEKEREEQRRLREQMREEERARREYEKAIQETQREEELIKQALTRARQDAEAAGAQERALLDQKMAELTQRLAEAEAKNQRALSMAQQTRKGNIYIISNVGSFGEDIFKIGMTRRLDPMERIWELSDASVPFDFDVHAIIASDDAPALEGRLHAAFDDLRINQVNLRKEFFRVPLERVRQLVAERGLEATFTMVAEAHEHRESLAISRMSPEARARYRANRLAATGAVSPP